MEILIARHAESIANTQGILQGQSYDTELSDLGKKQAPALGKALKEFKLDQIFASPLRRTAQTAEIITKTLLLEPPVFDDRLKEINHGELEGKDKPTIQQEYPEIINAWIKEPETVTFPQGESLQQLQDRAMDFLQEIGSQDYNRILVVCHDTVIRVALNKILRRQLSDHWLYQLDAAGYSIIDWNGKLNHVIKINQNEHLKGLASDLSTHAL